MMDLGPLTRRARYANATGTPCYLTADEWPQLWRAYMERVHGPWSLIAAEMPATPAEGTRLFGAEVQVSDPLAAEQADAASRFHGRASC